MSEALPTVAQVRETLSKIDAEKDAKINELNKQAKDDKTKIDENHAREAGVEKKAVDTRIAKFKDDVRKAHREATVKWNRVLRALQAEEAAAGSDKKEETKPEAKEPEKEPEKSPAEEFTGDEPRENDDYGSAEASGAGAQTVKH